MARRSLAQLVGAVLLVLCIGAASPAGADPDRGVSGPSLRVDIPTHVQVGRPIEVRLALERAADIGGYEAELLFDAAAHLSSPLDLEGELGSSGRGVESLGPVELPRGGVSVGAFSCPAEDCARPAEGGVVGRGVGGDVELATLTVVPQRAGKLELKLGAIRVVDTKGNPIDVSVKDKEFVVPAGSQDASTVYEAPNTIPRTSKAGSSSRLGPSDLTGDGGVGYADVAEASIAWTTLREGGASCSGDGCIDVADLQAVTADYGTSSAAPQVAQDRSVSALAASTFTVNSTTDGVDANAGDGICATAQGACTLRAAIAESNLHIGPDTIAFAIPGGGAKTINIASTLPTINDATGPTTIDGYTQPGAAPNTDTLASNARITVQVTTPRKYDPAIYGLTVASTGNTIRGLSVYGIQKNIWLMGRKARNNMIAGNIIGTNATATYQAQSFRKLGEGVAVQGGASLNEIGVANPAGRNIISGNARRGIAFFPPDTDSNRVVNNIVGLGPGGDVKVPNWKIGVDLNIDAADNQIGGIEQYERNVISGNGRESSMPGQGIELSHGPEIAGNRVIGNFFGTDLAGTAGPAYAALAGGAVNFEDRTGVGNLIEGNVIGNSGTGVRIISASNVRIQNNKIGVSLNSSPIRNSEEGVLINNVEGNMAVDSRISGNVIANNSKGVVIFGTPNDRNTISRNSIFANTGLGIDLEPIGGVNPNDAGDADGGANQQLNFPVIKTATPANVTGTACGGCTVEIFRADAGAGAYGEGRTFVGSSVAAGDGTFVVPVTGVARGQYVTATATDAAGNTSEFSLNKSVS